MIYLKNTSYSNNGLWTVETTDALFCLSKPVYCFFVVYIVLCRRCSYRFALFPITFIL